MIVLKTENMSRYFGGLMALNRVNMEFRDYRDRVVEILNKG